MQLMKSFLVAASILAGNAFAADLKTVDVVAAGDTEALRWYSQCIANLELDRDVALQYRFGETAEWQEIVVEQNQIWQFNQRFDTDRGPLDLQVKFLSRDADGVEISHDVEGTQTLLRQRSCVNVANYEFLETTARDGSIDLFPAL